MKPAEEIAAEIVNGLSFSSNRMLNGRLVGEQYFAADAITRAIKLDRLYMASSMTMGEVRRHLGGKKRPTHEEIMDAVNAILQSRAGSQCR
jgi:hypothetical protein